MARYAEVEAKLGPTICRRLLAVFETSSCTQEDLGRGPALIATSRVVFRQAEGGQSFQAFCVATSTFSDRILSWWARLHTRIQQATSPPKPSSSPPGPPPAYTLFEPLGLISLQQHLCFPKSMARQSQASLRCWHSGGATGIRSLSKRSTARKGIQRHLSS